MKMKYSTLFLGAFLVGKSMSIHLQAHDSSSSYLEYLKNQHSDLQGTLNELDDHIKAT